MTESEAATRPDTARADRRAAIVFNPTKVDIDTIKQAVTNEPASADWAETLWLETTAEDAGQDAAARALAAGATMVVAASGDGTVRAVAEALDGHAVSLAILPAGTGNLLARNLDLVLEDVTDAIHTAFAGADRAIDLTRIQIRRPDSTISEHVFVVMAGIGLDAAMLERTDDELKKKIGWLAYAQAIVSAIRDKNELRLNFAVDGAAARSIRAHTLIVGNCRSLTGNILLLPDARLDDGHFDIVLMPPDSFIGRSSSKWSGKTVCCTG